MGIIQKVFAPLMKFRRVYKSMVDGTPEELAQSKQLSDSTKSIKERHEQIQAEIGSTKSGLLKMLSTKLKRSESIKAEMWEHQKQLERLVQQLGDSNADKEAIFNELQKLGFSFDDIGKPIARTQDLLDQLASVGKIDQVIDLRGIMDRTKQLSIDHKELQQSIDDFQSSIVSSPSIKSHQVIDDAASSALKSGVPQKVVQDLTQSLKSKLSKKL